MPTADDYRKHYTELSDEALLEIRKSDLIPEAQNCYDEELRQRGLNQPSPTPASEEEAAGSEPGQEQLAEAAVYTSIEEANVARMLLRSAGIPSGFSGGYGGPGDVVRLTVPADLLDQAQEVLAAELSEEELAAQAEAAGLLEEDGTDPEED
jgi:hypothetical protein